MKIYDELCLSVNEEYSHAHKENVKDYFFPFYRSSI
jgi:hypothetical protein